MRVGLILLFVSVLLTMIAVTVYASLDRNLLAAGPQVSASRWFQATLVDAYCGFVTFYVWVAYREATSTARVVWFVLVMLLGNIAMAGYMIIRLWKWDPNRGVQDLLLRQPLS